MISRIWIGIIIGFFAYVGFARPVFAVPGAASLYLSPADGVFSVGSTLEVGLYLNTGGNNANVVRADLSFPPDKLQVIAPTLGKSVIPLWVIQPTFSNSEGKISFQGAIPPPGINTTGGLVSSMMFRVIGVGKVVISLHDSSRAYLADGTGTDILGARSDALFSLKLPAPAGPRVVAPQHPDPNNWYRNADVRFIWEMPPGATSVSYVLSSDPLAVPDDIPEGSQTSVLYRDVPSGMHYFHIKAFNPDSGWGGTTHFQVNIDHTPPAEFPIEFNQGANTTVRRPVAVFGTTDADSGMSHYAIRVIPLTESRGEVRAPEKSDQPFFIEATSPFILPELNLGSYHMVVRAYDNAGNFRDAESRLTIREGIFKNLGPDGIEIRSSTVLSWWMVYTILTALGIVLLYLAHFAWRGHREIEQKLAIGAMHFVERRLASRLALLKQKREEFNRNKLP